MVFQKKRKEERIPRCNFLEWDSRTLSLSELKDPSFSPPPSTQAQHALLEEKQSISKTDSSYLVIYEAIYPRSILVYKEDQWNRDTVSLLGISFNWKDFRDMHQVLCRFVERKNLGQVSLSSEILTYFLLGIWAYCITLNSTIL